MLFYNSEGLHLHSDPIYLDGLDLDLRDLKDLKGGPQPLLFFFTAKVSSYIPILYTSMVYELDLRDLEDLKGGPQRSVTNSYLCGIRSQQLP